MRSVYIDIHIHTSENPERMNNNYNVDLLLNKIDEVSGESERLISLSDHNCINKKAYLDLLRRERNVILGVELHIKNYNERPPYHCHILLNVSEINEDTIDRINEILDELYPVKNVTPESKVPNIEDIVRAFDDYDILLLPHGGQSHSTFDKSITAGTKFDTTLERSIYYNQFDGFTARNASGLDRTKSYFKKLGIDEFVNLVTCTDNYNPRIYPNAKTDSEASPFVPTWMFAEPTFNGFRLSLSEPSRLYYGNEKPKIWSEYIKSAKLDTDKVSIDVNFTPGLNVVIGGSSSGKTLLVDSIFRAIIDDFEESVYNDFGISELKIEYPAGSIPHYLHQNYIMKIIDNADRENTINDIDIIKDVFPGDKRLARKINRALASFKEDIRDLVDSVSQIETLENKINRIPALPRLIKYKKCRKNPIDRIIPKGKKIEYLEYDEGKYDSDIELLKGIQSLIKNHPIVEYDPEPFRLIKESLSEILTISEINDSVLSILNESKRNIDKQIEKEDGEAKRKETLFSDLLGYISKYIEHLSSFYSKIDKIESYNVACESETVVSMGHELSIENNFKLDKEAITKIINKYLKQSNRITSLDNLRPENLYECNHSKKSPKVHNYDDFSNKIYAEFESQNAKKYRIISKDGRDFDTLSAGWKTSILLDLIIGYSEDVAPLIIDQPEDNLATDYINRGLIKAIMKTKKSKQIILVSHNATIPMMGDAQNVILCKNEGKIIVCSQPLEGFIGGKSMVDHVAEITDGGKSSIKKRVKKYNLKTYRGEE